jgi:hypothetical protein
VSSVSRAEAEVVSMTAALLELMQDLKDLSPGSL